MSTNYFDCVPGRSVSELKLPDVSEAPEFEDVSGFVVAGLVAVGDEPPGTAPDVPPEVGPAPDADGVRDGVPDGCEGADEGETASGGRGGRLGRYKAPGCPHADRVVTTAIKPASMMGRRKHGKIMRTHYHE